MVAFVAYLFKRVIQFLESTSKLDMLAQDAATITAGDFTCEMDITPKMWRYYLDVIYEEQVVKTGLQEESGELYSPALYLKKHLNQEIKRILTASLKYRTEKEKAESKGPIHHKEKHLPGNREKPTEVECKGIQFAYNNYQIIDILKKRGSAIANCKWEVVTKCDQQLTEMVKDESNYEKFTTPVCAFVTFESDDGQLEALSFSKQHHWYDLRDRKDPYKGFPKEKILGEKAHFIAGVRTSKEERGEQLCA